MSQARKSEKLDPWDEISRDFNWLLLPNQPNLFVLESEMIKQIIKD